MTAADKIVGLLSLLGEDEIEVLLHATKRLVHGRQQYGELIIDTDRRDWLKEAIEEDLDGLIYRSVHAVKLSRVKP